MKHFSQLVCLCQESGIYHRGCGKCAPNLHLLSGTNFCRYDPYARVMTREAYDHSGMRAARRAAIERARGCKKWGLVLGTLGRQGNPRILKTLQSMMAERGFTYVLVCLQHACNLLLGKMRTQLVGPTRLPIQIRPC